MAQSFHAAQRFKSNGAKQRALDPNESRVNVDVVDTKTDDFLFGTGAHAGQDGVGPFACVVV